MAHESGGRKWRRTSRFVLSPAVPVQADSRTVPAIYGGRDEWEGDAVRRQQSTITELRAEATQSIEKLQQEVSTSHPAYTSNMAAFVNIQATGKELEKADLEAKQSALYESLRSLGRVIIAYSGGTDSAYLAWAAHQVLGDSAIAITADSASIPESHKRDAEAFARESGFRHGYIATNE